MMRSTSKGDGGVFGFACLIAFGLLAGGEPAAALDLSDAEVIVTSSSNTAYVGMTNTDGQGRFVLNGVPPGGITVVIRRNGVTLAQGAGVTAGGSLNEATILEITVAPPPGNLKSGPRK